VLKSQIRRFAGLENLDAEVDINRAWKTTKENIKISAKESLGYYELKQHKPWFGERCSKLLDRRKQAKTAVVTGSKRNKWGSSEQYKT
jgi:hypothetical protein